MIIDIVMPKMGESITEGTILEWRKKVGESIALDEILLEIGTDKVDSEIPCPNAGIVVEILGEVNQVMDVGAVIARIETDENQANTKQEMQLDNEIENEDKEEKNETLKETNTSSNIEIKNETNQNLAQVLDHFNSLFKTDLKKDEKLRKPLSFKFVRVLNNGFYRFDFSETFYKLEIIMVSGANMTFFNNHKDKILDLDF